MLKLASVEYVPLKLLMQLSKLCHQSIYGKVLPHFAHQQSVAVCNAQQCLQSNRVIVTGYAVVPFSVI